MKILLLGKNGQVGWELQRSLAPLGELVALDRNSTPLCGDMSNLDGIAQTVRTTSPDVIVNAAAYTAVDKAESEREAAFLINTQAAGVLAQEAQKCGALLVHYSTDYVFDGSGSKPWTETDATNPLSVYGTSKRDGELAIQSSGCTYLIFRTSWVYGTHGNNFVKTILRLAKERASLSIVGDQIGAPTGAVLIANVTAAAIGAVSQDATKSGLYHLTASGETSWHQYAQFIVDCAQKSGAALKTNAETIAAIPTRDYPTPARRPLNSRLDTSKLQRAFALPLPTWQEGAAHVLSEIL